MSTIHDTHSKWFMSRVSHVTRESCHTHVWVMSLIHTRDMTHLNDFCYVCLYEFCHWVVVRESYYTYACTMPYLCIIYVSLMNKDECVISCSILFACLINRHAKKRKAWLICHVIDFYNPWNTCLMGYVTHESRHTHAWVMSLIHTRDMTYFNDVCRVCLYESCHVHTWVMSHDWIAHVTWLI